MDLPVLSRRIQVPHDREEAQGGGGKLDLCDGSPGMEYRHRSRYVSPPRAENSKTESMSCHPSHITTHFLEVAPLCSPCGSRGGSTPLPHLVRLGAGGGRHGLAIVGISSRNQQLEGTSCADDGLSHSPG